MEFCSFKNKLSFGVMPTLNISIKAESVFVASSVLYLFKK